jgi:teichuronic acid biosynthesis glycosyltransferase TuaC
MSAVLAGRSIARDAAPALPSGDRLKVLMLSRNYPNNVLPLLGLWVEGLARHLGPSCDVRVVSPVPYCPPLPGLSRNYSRYRAIARRREHAGVEVRHPRMLVAPGYRFHAWEGRLYEAAAAGEVARLRREFAFDLIHAHFTYPDGWVGARLAARYRVPLVITEHAPWVPWMNDYPAVRRRAMQAAAQCACHIAVSRSVRDEIASFTGDSARLKVIPCGVDTSVFVPVETGRTPDQILFAGAVRHVKGVDVLLRALRLLRDRGRELGLVLVGEALFESYRRCLEDLRRLAAELGLAGCVEFVGGKPAAELAGYMQRSALLVLPSRQESLGMVLAEALACGTPVVATRCGGPLDIVHEGVGVLVEPESPQALAEGIERVLDQRERYASAALSEYAAGKFSWQRVAAEVAAVYREAAGRRAPARSAS